MKKLFRFILVLAGVSFFSLPILADSPADQSSKAEKDYQNWIKSHVGYKLLVVEYDKFKKQTRIANDPRMANELEFKKPDGGGLDMDLMVAAYIPDNNLGSVNLLIAAHGNSDSSWRYLDCHDFNWLVDDKDLKWDDFDYDNHVFDDASTSEYMTLTVSLSNFKKLVGAQKIECKVCNDEFVFQPKQKWVMRWVLEQIQALQAKAGK